MKAKTFDLKFDAGEKIVDQLDLSKTQRVGTDAKRVNVDFPAWLESQSPTSPADPVSGCCRFHPFGRATSSRFTEGQCCRLAMCCRAATA